MVMYAGNGQQPSKLYTPLGQNDQLFCNTVDLAHKAAVDMKIPVAELESYINTKRRTKRLPARVEAVLKESELIKYESRLQHALKLLSTFMYLTKMHT